MKMQKIFPLRLQVGMNKVIHEQLKTMADKQGCSMADIVRALIEQAYAGQA